SNIIIRSTCIFHPIQSPSSILHLPCTDIHSHDLLQNHNHQETQHHDLYQLSMDREHWKCIHYARPPRLSVFGSKTTKNQQPTTATTIMERRENQNEDRDDHGDDNEQDEESDEFNSGDGRRRTLGSVMCYVL